ncbi:glycoside hydrolase family 18 protein [Janthinobacterium sp. B9-8]|uniref:glycoside hydrolase family 18 protein n=1 Tax=Janthinobacterium sp. B9-8 TaxID=1236179 RepID=UPI00061D143D|nr:glycoside hydrolase family 18 protein [Janthinobacterium sp. B9-8]AMC34696.1 hypothetical protein VN23_08795 [Janthinobacterium sp. B9-8]
MKKILIAFAAASLLGACASTPSKNTVVSVEPAIPTVKSHDKQVVAYIRTWPIGSTPKDMDMGRRWRASDIQGNQLTTLNLSFGLIRNGTEVYIKDLEPQPNSDKTATIAPFANMWDEVAKLQSQYPHLKVNVSIGGWGADGFSQMARTPETRKQFIANVIKLIDEHKLAGIDYDWEYPVGPDWLPIAKDPSDKENYPKLLEETKAALNQYGAKTGKQYQLSVAVPAAAWFLQNIDVIRVAKSVDYMKVMAYDFAGSWSKKTSHHTNLYQNKADPEGGGWSADQAMSLYLNAGVKPEKLLMGSAFYGRAWQGVASTNNGLFNAYKKAAYDDGITWQDIKALKAKGATRYWDPVAKAPWLFDGDLMVTYEDQESLKYKAQYIKSKQLGGIMVWEYGHDMDSELPRVINQSLM